MWSLTHGHLVLRLDKSCIKVSHTLYMTWILSPTTGLCMPVYECMKDTCWPPVDGAPWCSKLSQWLEVLARIPLLVPVIRTNSHNIIIMKTEFLSWLQNKAFYVYQLLALRRLEHLVKMSGIVESYYIHQYCLCVCNCFLVFNLCYSCCAGLYVHLGSAHYYIDVGVYLLW